MAKERNKNNLKKVEIIINEKQTTKIVNWFLAEYLII